jgi:hypothetical protein
MILKINDIRVGDGQYDTPSAFTLAAASTSTGSYQTRSAISHRQRTSATTIAFTLPWTNEYRTKRCVLACESVFLGHWRLCEPGVSFKTPGRRCLYAFSFSNRPNQPLWYKRLPKTGPADAAMTKAAKATPPPRTTWANTTTSSGSTLGLERPTNLTHNNLLCF